MSTQGKAGDPVEPGANIEPIDPISVDELRRYAIEGKLDRGVEALREKELDYIKMKRGSPKDLDGSDLAGLALSGGGIRSATFALGVMQALAKTGVLARMDYLSTVSGGGYIGSALTWFLGPQNSKDESGKDTFGLEKDNFPFGHDSGRKSNDTQRKMLDWLRQHGKYLTPGKGITLMSGIAVVLRGILLNLLVWIPLGIAVFWLLLGGADCLTIVLEHMRTGLPLSLSYCAEPQLVHFIQPQRGDGFVLALVSIAAVLAILFILFGVTYSFATFFPKKNPTNWRYWFRRFFEITAPWLLMPALVLLVVATLPFAADAISEQAHEAGGPIAALIGLLMALWGFLRTRGTKMRPGSPLVPTIGAALILYGFGLFSFQLALALPVELQKISIFWYLVLGLAVLIGVFVNINYISIHRYYRDRLMETYLPNVEQVMTGKTGMATAANSAVLQSVSESDDARAPCQIVNANVVLVNSTKSRWRLRGGDSFVLTPFYCGSSATGWLPTENFLGGRLTRATAMAISGAAANPNAGGGGVGVTRNRAVSLLMALLNIRLGYWVPNWRRSCRWFSPNHFVPGLSQISRGHKETACFIELSDGGHFENLALYELVRRRLKLIILCDGAADPKFGFADLNSLRRRVAADFGARIFFENGHNPEQMIPRRLKQVAPDGAGYATRNDMAERGFLLGRIEYASPMGKPQETGALVYIKTTMVADLPFGVKAYKGAHHDFPDETTADQFFDEEQFDAYRELGRHLGERMIDTIELDQKIGEIIAAGRWTDEILRKAEPPT